MGVGGGGGGGGGGTMPAEIGSNIKTESELFMATFSARYLFICEESINLGTQVWKPSSYVDT